MKNTHPPVAPEMLSPVQLSQRIGVGVRTLASWRLKKKGPVYLKFGDDPKSEVRYTVQDVIAWEESLPRFGRPVEQKGEAA